MQALLRVSCEGCGKYLADVKVDTADMPEELQLKVNHVILLHRKFCHYYHEDDECLRIYVFGGGASVGS
jgi:hypothetical protein